MSTFICTFNCKCVPIECGCVRIDEFDQCWLINLYGQWRLMERELIQSIGCTTTPQQTDESMALVNECWWINYVRSHGSGSDSSFGQMKPYVCLSKMSNTHDRERAHTHTHTHTQKAHIYQIVSIYLVDLVESMKLSLKWMFGKNVQRFMAGRCWMAAHRINSNRRWWRRIGWRRKVGWTGSPQ